MEMISKMAERVASMKRADVPHLEIPLYPVSMDEARIGAVAERLAAGKSVDRMIAELKSKFRMTWVKDGAEFDGSGAVLWSGEGCYIFVRGEKVEAFDYYSENHSTYEFGVHKALVAWGRANGVTWQANDPGTYLAYRD